MKKLKVLLLMLLTGVMLTFVGCKDGAGGGTPADPDDGNQPTPAVTLQIGVMFADEPILDGKITVDYKNALSGITFYDKESSGRDPIDKELTALTVDGSAVGADNYDYADGFLEFDAQWLRSLTLGTEYAVKATFGESAAEFKMTLSDTGKPAYSYADAVIKDVYLTGGEITLPTATKSPASIQNTKVEYELTDASGAVQEIRNNKFAAETEGKYTYTVKFYKNDAVEETKTRDFTVIDLKTANLASEDVAVVLGGTYSKTEQAAGFAGKSGISQIEIADSYKYLRVEYKGKGTITLDQKDDESIIKDPVELESAEYKTVWLSAEKVNTVQIEGKENFYIKSFTVSDVSAFNAYDLENLNFASKDVFSSWKHTPHSTDGGTFAYDDGKGAFVMPASVQLYTLREHVLKAAYDNGYKYVVFGYKNAGRINIFNDSVENGDWGGYIQDLPVQSGEIARRVAYSLDTAAEVDRNAIDATSGIAVYVASGTLELYEVRFYKTDVIAEEEARYALVESDLVSRENAGKWSGGTFDKVMTFAKGGNYTLGENVLFNGQDKRGKNALRFIASGKGKVTLNSGNASDAPAEINVDSTSGYTEYVVYFGGLTFTESGNISVEADAAVDLSVRNMRLVNSEGTASSPVILSENMAVAGNADKWETRGGTLAYDSIENALKVGSYGNDCYSFHISMLSEAVSMGYDYIEITAKGRMGFYMSVKGDQWNTVGIKINFNKNLGWGWDDSANAFKETGYITLADIDLSKEYELTVNNGGSGDGYLYSIKFKSYDDCLTDGTITVEDGAGYTAQDIYDIFRGGANLASEKYAGLWKANVQSATVSWNTEVGALNMNMTAKCNKTVYFGIEDWAKYALLFGKTKVVWNYSSEDGVAANTRVRLYNAEIWGGSATTTLVSVNGKGDGNNGGKKEIALAKAYEEANYPDCVFAVDANQGAADINFTDIRFE